MASFPVSVADSSAIGGEDVGGARDCVSEEVDSSKGCSGGGAGAVSASGEAASARGGGS